MKLKPDHKAIFVMIGILFAWFALYIMLAPFYEGVVQASIASVQGGVYSPYYLRGENMVIWLICITVSAVCLAIGLRAEELK